MALPKVPNEILIQVVELLDHEHDINSLTRCSRHLYHLCNTYLYKHNIKFHNSSAVLWAAEHGSESSLRKLLELGADINLVNLKTTSSYRYNLCDNTWKGALNGLYLACLNGHAGIARLLLEAGINDSEYARERESMPLYYALRQGHDDVALVLLEYFSDVNKTLSWTESVSPSLHLASYLGLPSLVRLLLNRGADLQVEDMDGMTALHYAVLGSREVCKGCFDGSFFAMRKGLRFESKGDGLGSDVETAKLLLEAGADMGHKRQNTSWRHRHSASQLARNHPSRKMRELFGADGGWLRWAVGWK